MPSATGSPSPRPGVIAPVAVIALSGVVLFLAVKMFFADLRAYQASVFLEDWQSRGAAPSAAAWQVAEGAALAAADGYPVASGAYLEQLGRLYEWRHLKAFPGNAGAQSSRRAALDAYRRAVAARPAWPHTWARLAVVKLNLLEFDDEFDHALSNAYRYGASRPRVNYLLGELGITAWRELTPPQRDIVRKAIRNLDGRDDPRVKSLYAYADRLGVRDDVTGIR